MCCVFLPLRSQSQNVNADTLHKGYPQQSYKAKFKTLNTLNLRCSTPWIDWFEIQSKEQSCQNQLICTLTLLIKALKQSGEIRERMRDKEGNTMIWRERHLSVPKLGHITVSQKATVAQTLCLTSFSLGPRMWWAVESYCLCCQLPTALLAESCKRMSHRATVGLSTLPAWSQSPPHIHTPLQPKPVDHQLWMQTSQDSLTLNLYWVLLWRFLMVQDSSSPS